MRAVAITGNAAAGKSAVAGLFETWGAARLDADAVVRELQAPGQPVLAAISHRFGPGVTRPDGSLDRAALRAMVLADPHALADLNAIVHPAVRARIRSWLDRQATLGTAVAVVEIPLLFEAGMADGFDCVVLVDAPRSLQVERLETSRGLDRQAAERLLSVQAPPGPKRERSDFVIVNDGSREALGAAAREVWRALREGA